MFRNLVLLFVAVIGLGLAGCGNSQVDSAGSPVGNWKATPADPGPGTPMTIEARLVITSSQVTLTQTCTGTGPTPSQTVTASSAIQINTGAKQVTLASALDATRPMAGAAHGRDCIIAYESGAYKYEINGKTLKLTDPSGEVWPTLTRE